MDFRRKYLLLPSFSSRLIALITCHEALNCIEFHEMSNPQKFKQSNKKVAKFTNPREIDILFIKIFTQTSCFFTLISTNQFERSECLMSRKIGVLKRREVYSFCPRACFIEQKNVQDF